MFVYDDANYFDSGLMDFVTGEVISDFRCRIYFYFGMQKF